MSEVFRTYEPEQMLLMPVALREWLPLDHLAYCISDVVDYLSAIMSRYEDKERGYAPYHPPMKVKVLFYAYCIGVPSSREIEKRLHEDIAFIKSAHIEDLMKPLHRPAGKRLSLPGGLVFYGDYHHSLMTREAPRYPLPVLEGEYRLNIPGETELPGWRVVATILGQCPEEGDAFCAHLDFAVTGDELFVRRRKHSDRLQPLGREQPKKLQDFMVDAKIPRSLRDRVPIVSSPHHILWVVGWRIDHRARVTPQTERIPCLKFQKV